MEEQESAGGASLSLHLELGRGLPRPAGTVVLSNTGGADVKAWNTGNSWGDTVLSFEVLHEGSTRHLVRRPQEYTRNVPSSFVLRAGEKHEWPFELIDDDWEGDAPVSQLLARGAELVALYHVPPTPEADTHGVWTGTLRSNPFLLD